MCVWEARLVGVLWGAGRLDEAMVGIWCVERWEMLEWVLGLCGLVGGSCVSGWWISWWVGEWMTADTGRWMSRCWWTGGQMGG